MTKVDASSAWLSGKPVLSVEHVGVTYRRRALLGGARAFDALKDISFDLYHGESLAVIGRNGAGKSTLLKVLSGIIEPDRGRIRSAGYSVALLSRQVGFDPMLSGRDNATLSALLLGFRRREINARMDAIIAFAELEDFIDEPLGTYSLGMRARLGFAVSLELSPDILLIDETLGVGDAAFQAKSGEVIARRLQSDKTVVLVSHNADAIKRLCNRAVWIEQGRTVMEGGAAEVADAYEASASRRAGSAWRHRIANADD